MARRIISVFAGLIAAVVIFMGMERVSSAIYPLPPGLDRHDHHALSIYIANLPLNALLVVLAGWILGSFICGFIIRIISKTPAKTPAYIAGLFLTTAGIVNLLTLPHPVWFIIMGTAVFIPFTLLGHVVAPKRVAEPA